MKFFYFILLGLLSLSASAAERYCNVLVMKVYDGDTFTASVNSNIVRVRLSNIDAPELNQPDGIEARVFLRNLIFGKKVCIDKQSTDIYRRWIADVYSEGFLVSRLLVSAGHAWVYTKFNTDILLKEFETQAKAGKKGVWIEDDPIAPWNWRKIRKQRPLSTH